MSKLYIVCVRWLSPDLRPEKIDTALGTLGDWLRFNGTTWFVFTNASAERVHQIARTMLETSDSALVMRADPTEIAGWAPSNVWTWLQGKTPEHALDEVLDRLESQS